MENQKQKILKFAILPMFIFSFVFLLGCNKSASINTFNTTSLNMDKIINDINKIEVIDTSDLIISDFMDEDNMVMIDGISTLKETTNSIDNYVLKISILNNTIYNTVEINVAVNNAKKKIIAKAHQVKSLCEQCKDEKNTISNENLDTLEELNSLVMSNNTRATISRNEVKNVLANINNIKDNYYQKAEQLSSRYEKLQGCLNTRLSYYNNILTGLDSISFVVTSNCNNCNYCENTTYNQEDNEATQTTAKTEETKNKKLKKNIDSYENAGTNFNQLFNNNPIYNQDGYLNGYNGFYNQYPNNPYSGYNMGYGNMFGNYGYRMGTPYGFGYGYTFPNINSFWTYKNIDTYKPRPIPKNYNENDSENDAYEEETTQETFNNNIESFPNPLKSQDNDVSNKTYNGENNFVDRNEKTDVDIPIRPKPMPRPFIPNKEMPRVYKQDNIAVYNSNEDTINQSLFKDGNYDDGEDKFVNAPINKPTIEKLDN